jgi:alkylhydroperoxidase family enzyme
MVTSPVLDHLTSLDDLERLPVGAAWRAYHAALRTHPSLPRRVALVCRLRTAQLLGGLPAPDAGWSPVDRDRAQQLQHWMTSPLFDARDRACLAYAEQFLVDANGIDASLAGPVADELGDTGLVVLTVWLGVVEAEERLRHLLDLEAGHRTTVLDGVGSDDGPTERTVDPDRHPWPSVHDPRPPSVQELLDAHAPALAAARAAVGLADGQRNPARVNELLRLISANAVDCRFCRNVRYRGSGATQLVAEEEIPALLAGSVEVFTDREAAAVLLGRAFFDGTGPLTAEQVAVLTGAFDDDALVEALVTTMRNPSGSKAMVALGLVPDDTPLVVL